MIYSIHDNGDLLAADISSPSGNINVISYMPITVQVITRADTFFMIGNNANTELNKYQGELTLFCTGSASYSVYKNNYIAANRLGTASPNTAFNITKNWIGSIFVDDTGTSSAPNEIFKLYIFKGMLSTQECIAKAGFRGEDHVIFEGSSRLPPEYEELEYIRSNGGQYILFDIVQRLSTNYVMEADFKFNNTIRTQFFGFNSGSYFGTTGGFFSIGTSPHMGTADLLKHHIKMTQTNIGSTMRTTTILDDTKTSTRDRTNFNQSNKFSLFTLAGQDAFICFMDLYPVKLSDSGVLILTLIPARRRSDNVVGMYDTVSNQFFTNNGTGSFIAGPVVNNITQRRIQA